MRDIVDRVGYCCATNDFEAAWPAMFNEPFPDSATLLSMTDNRDSVKGQAAWMAQQHKTAAQLCYAAQTSSPLNAVDNQQAKETILKDCYPHFKRYTDTISNLLPRIIDARKKLNKTFSAMEPNNANYEPLKEQLTELHALGDTMVFSVPDEVKNAAYYKKFLNETPGGRLLAERIESNKQYCNEVILETGLRNNFAATEQTARIA